MLTALQKLQAAQTRADLARLLGFSPSGFTYILYKIAPEKKYKQFSIPKKSGGHRDISAPTEKLCLLQRRLADLLQDCHDQIAHKSNKHRHISHGFRRDHSIFTNAYRHKKKKHSFNVDLEDFFSCFNFGRVRGFFIKDENFKLNPSIATTIAQISCHKNKLPQGSPSSPVITNLIFHITDLRLLQLASKNRCVYTRYADDLTFSTNQKFFPEVIATPSHEDFDKWVPGKGVIKEIEKSGFSINKKKTRMQYPGSRMETTGLTHNSRVNTKKEYRLRTRAMVRNLIEEKPVHIDREYNPKDPKDLNELKSKLAGRLAHTHHIDRMHERYSEGTHNQRVRPQNELSLRDKTYRKFLLFSRFVNTEKPIVICEGKTDSVYLKCALKQLPKSFNRLTSENGDLKINFFRYSTTTANVLHLEGGESHLTSFIGTYINFVSNTKVSGLPNPVIILVDNDEGAKSIFSRARQILKHSVNGESPFYRLKYNLYLVALPKKDPKFEICIENFFDEKTLSIKINGKSFDKSNKTDSRYQYGKSYFSEYVVKKNQLTIDFSGFNTVLGRLNQAVEHYQSIK